MSILGNHFNSSTDSIFSGLGDWLVKQVDDIYILWTLLEELSSRLEVTAEEANENSCTWVISKYFAGRETNIISGHHVILNPSRQKAPQIGPDPKKLRN